MADYDESLDIENLDDQPEPDEPDDQGDDGSDGQEDPEPQQSRGNTGIALRQERERSRQYKADLENAQRQNQMYERLLQQSGQQQRQPQQHVDPQQYRQKFQDELFEAPDQVFERNNQQLTSQWRQQLFQQQAPLYRQTARNYLTSQDVYGIPEIKDALDGYVEMQIEQNGYVDLDGLADAVTKFRSIRDSLTGGGTSGQPSTKGKEKLTSTVTKGQQKRSGTTNLDELYTQVKAMKPSEYAKWEKQNPELDRQLMERFG